MKTEALASLLADRIQQHHSQQKPNRRTLIALAGGPGSGKTFIASAIADAVTSRGLKAQAVSIEGFVKPSHVLTDEQKQHKGSIDTFDGDAVVEFFKKLRELGPGHELSCPGFDEDNKFEPIPDGEKVHADAEVIIFEGIYMLADREPYTQLRAPLVDERWFIDVKPELVRQRVAERRLSKGKAPNMKESLRTYDESDSKNTKWISENVVDVDLTIHSDEECWVSWLDGRVEK
jgi:pantothenate kinase